MSEPTVNIPLLRKAIEWAEAEAAKPPDLCEWDQSDWVKPKSLQRGKAPECGTCYCIAGYVAQSVDARYATAMFVDNVHVENRARDALGLTSTLGLFNGDNTIADVRRIAEDIAGERL